jgi:hypothetical protein
VKRILPGVETVSIGTPEAVAAFAPARSEERDGHV